VKNDAVRFVRVGVGIAGMRERLRQLGGRLEIISGDKGTTVKATVPLQAPNGPVRSPTGKPSRR
jgi:signal transduction histidine kinase